MRLELEHLHLNILLQTKNMLVFFRAWLALRHGRGDTGAAPQAPRQRHRATGATPRAPRHGIWGNWVLKWRKFFRPLVFLIACVFRAPPRVKAPNGSPQWFSVPGTEVQTRWTSFGRKSNKSFFCGPRQTNQDTKGI